MSRLIRCGQALAIGAAVTLLAGPAGAEPSHRLAQLYPAYPVYPAPPPPPHGFRRHQADAAVRSLGLIPIGPIQGHGPVFIVAAVGREGSQVEVTLDRYTGRVLQITRLGRGAPHVATRPAVPAPGYERGDDEDHAALDDDEIPPVLPQAAPGYRGPNVVTRDPAVTNSIPRQAAPRPADPLLGVPKEFRGGQAPVREDQQRLAARPPDPIPRVAPLPLPRPADAPSVARNETSPPAVAESKPAAKPDVKAIPDVQGFE